MISSRNEKVAFWTKEVDNIKESGRGTTFRASETKLCCKQDVNFPSAGLFCRTILSDLGFSSATHCSNFYISRERCKKSRSMNNKLAYTKWHSLLFDYGQYENKVSGARG